MKMKMLAMQKRQSMIEDYDVDDDGHFFILP